MKKTIMIFAALAAAALQTTAQNVFPAAGNVGIGTTAPSQALTIQTGNIIIPSANVGNSGNLYFGGQTFLGENGMRLFGGDVNGSIPAGFIDVKTSDLTDGLRIRVDNAVGGIERMRIAANGNVTIGAVTTPAGYKLFVEQGILTEKVKVAVKTSADWADYVFDEQYRLLPLDQVAQYIQQHKHLPGIPSATEMVKDGNDLGQTDAKLLSKIEELTLYVIDMNKQLQQLKQENQVLKSQIQSSKK
jgi:hypothetical protein